MEKISDIYFLFHSPHNHFQEKFKCHSSIEFYKMDDFPLHLPQNYEQVFRLAQNLADCCPCWIHWSMEPNSGRTHDPQCVHPNRQSAEKTSKGMHRICAILPDGKFTERFMNLKNSARDRHIMTYGCELGLRSVSRKCAG